MNLKATDLTNPAYTVQRYSATAITSAAQGSIEDEAESEHRPSFALANPAQVPALLCTHLRFKMDTGVDVGAGRGTPWIDRLAQALKVWRRQGALFFAKCNFHLTRKRHCFFPFCFLPYSTDLEPSNLSQRAGSLSIRPTRVPDDGAAHVR